MLFIVAIIFISCLFHDPLDPNLNLAISKNYQNILGQFGAYISAFFLDTFGLTTYYILIVLTLSTYLRKSFFRLLLFSTTSIFLSKSLHELGMSLNFIGRIFELNKNVCFAITVLLILCHFFLLKVPKISLPKRAKNKKIQKKEPKKEITSEFKNECYLNPSFELLSNKVSKEEQVDNNCSDLLLSVLDEFGIKGKICDVKIGPVITLYEFQPAPGTKSSRVIGLGEDIARNLSVVSIRISVIPGKNVLGIEIPNQKRKILSLKEIIDSENFSNFEGSLPLILGKTINGEDCIVDLAKMPHLMVAGTTGSGKSVAINVMIISLLYKYKPEDCKFIMIDPKMLELSIYQNIPHLITPVITEPSSAVVVLKWLVKEMENRYKLMSQVGVRNILSYNQKVAESNSGFISRTMQVGFDKNTGKPLYNTIEIQVEKMHYIVVVIDELADLMVVAGKDIEESVQRLAQMARAAGIHLIVATQRPSVDVITGVIKANFPTRISFKVTSKIDSRTILGEQGAEQLLGMGDMLYSDGSSKMVRIHGPFIEDIELQNITDFLRCQGAPKYIKFEEDSKD